jgi:galactokinase
VRLVRQQPPGEDEAGSLVALARSARALGAFGASSFGAGFGGSVWALVGQAEAADFAARWLASYRAEFPARDTATTFLAPLSPGLTRLS